MTVTESHLRLRLAARTLIELNTPVTSAEYQRVLTDLLKAHPYAASWGLTPDKELLKLDERGTVLWYLSETMTMKASKPLEDRSAQYVKALEKRSVDGLMDYGVVGDVNERRWWRDQWLQGERWWQGSYSKAQIADTIFEALQSEESIGYRSLLAIIVPLEPDLQQESLERLMDLKGARPSLVQRLYKLVRGVYGIAIASLVIWLVLFVFIIVNDMSGGREISFWQWVGMLILPLVLLTSGLWFREAVQRGIRNIVVLTSEGGKELSRQLHRLDVGSRLFAFIGDMCSTNGRILVSLLSSHSHNDWADIALSSTKSATPEVIQEVLNLIRNPDTNESMRDRLFQWLCKVSVIYT
jgi:uncharacterized integral membrane protein